MYPTNRFGFSPTFVFPTAAMRTRDTHIAVKSERTIPSPSISPNHLMSDIPKTYRITADVNEVMCESQIAVHDFVNPVVIALSIWCPARRDSFMRSKIRILASIASPIESMTQAIEARVRVTFVNLTRAIRMSE